MADTFTARFSPVHYQTIQSGSYTMQPGVVPSAGRIVCTEQLITQQLGALRLTWTSPETGTKVIYVPDCKIESISQVAVGVYEVIFLDRRWRWRYGHIDGVYNVQTGDNTWDYEKNPRQLMELCLQAMGEQGYDLSVVTSDEKLYVDWKGDVPAFALSEICRLLGYMVTINAQNRVKIVRAGEGGPLPNEGSLGAIVLQAETAAIDDGHRPEKIRVATAPVRYEVMFNLEAVGLQSDGEIKPLDEVDWFSALTSEQQLSLNSPRWGVIADDEDRQLAQQTAFKWYRISSMVNGGGASQFDPPGYLGEAGDVTSVYQLLPLLPVRNATETPVGSGYEVRKPFYIEGEFYQWQDKEAGGNSSSGTRYPFGANIDAERGIVRFPTPVGLVTDNSGTFEWGPATLQLVCCVEVRAPQNNQQQYYGWTWDAGGLVGAGTLTIIRSELIPEVNNSYSNGSWSSREDNLAEIKTEAEKFAQAQLRNLRPLARSTKQFAGFHPVALDGLIQEVSWSWGGSGPMTRVAAGGPYGAGPSPKATARAVANKQRQRKQERSDPERPFRNYRKGLEVTQ